MEVVCDLHNFRSIIEFSAILTHIMTHRFNTKRKKRPTDIFQFKSPQSLILSALPSDVNSPWARSDPRAFSRYQIEAVFKPYGLCFRYLSGRLSLRTNITCLKWIFTIFLYGLDFFL